MRNIQWYFDAARNLGIVSLGRLYLQKYLGCFDEPLLMKAKTLRHPIYARRDTSDLSVFDQIFAERQYGCVDGVDTPDLIIDCGANVGYSAVYFLLKFPTARVIAVEPDADNFAMLEKNVAPYGDRCRSLLAAVWPREEKLKLQRPDRRNFEWAISVAPGEGNIRAVTIPSLIAMSGQQRVSILKIDIEGAEQELFRSRSAWLDQIDNIVIELHGTDCEDAFLSAIDGRGYLISRCGELTVCLKAGDSKESQKACAVQFGQV